MPTTDHQRRRSAGVPTVLLFDVDGTLIHSGGAGRRALERAFVAQLGSARALDFFWAGMTDRAIVAEGLRRAGADAGADAVARVIEQYLAALPAEVARSEGFAVCPGVAARLAELRRLPGVAVGLGTGNVARGARIKLGRVDLWDRFDFGGFGSDSDDRRELLAVGARRGARLLGVGVADCRVVVIGDTPRDVAAGRAIGARCVGVATGPHQVEELDAAGADATVVDLARPAALQALLGERPS